MPIKVRTTQSVLAAGLNDGEWHHLVGVRQGAMMALYVDGTLYATNFSVMPEPFETSYPFGIGVAALTEA